MTDDRRGVGVVGLGAMGLPIAARLVRSGFHVQGVDQRPDRRKALDAVDGQGVESVAAAVSGSAVLLTVLPSSEALRAVTDEIAAAPGVRPIVVDMSTLDLATKEAARRTLAGAGITLLDCTLSGTAIQAEAGDLVVYASGDAAALDVAAPVFAGFARGVHRVGAFGNGTRLKLVANLLVATHIATAAEALVLAEHAGLDPLRTLEALADGAGTSRMLEVRGPMMIDRDYRPASMTLALFDKDLRLIRAFVDAVGSPAPMLAAAREQFAAALAAGRGEDDTASIVEVLRAAGGGPD